MKIITTVIVIAAAVIMAVAIALACVAFSAAGWALEEFEEWRG